MAAIVSVAVSFRYANIQAEWEYYLIDGHVPGTWDPDVCEPRDWWAVKGRDGFEKSWEK